MDLDPHVSLPVETSSVTKADMLTEEGEQVSQAADSIWKSFAEIASNVAEKVSILLPPIVYIYV